MQGDKYLKQLFKDGISSDEDIVKYCIKYYFLKGYSLDDFEDDLILKYNTSESYAKALKESFENTLKKYSN